MHGGEGRGEGKWAEKLSALAGQCEAFDCASVDIETIDCNLTKPERPDNIMAMSPEDKEAARAEMKAAREALRQDALSCGCCTDATFEELLLAGKWGSRGEGFGKPGYSGHHGGWAAKKEWLEDACELYDCDLLDAGSINCDMTRPERLDWSSIPEEERESARLEMKASMKAYRQETLKCGCCTDKTFDELIGRNFEDSTTSEDGSEEDSSSEDGIADVFESTEISVSKASLLKGEANVETEESYLKNSGGRRVLSFALIASAGGVYFLI
jgi:hypothetical protein